MIKRLAFYSSAEKKDYPSNLWERGVIDIDVWLLSIEAKSDDERFYELLHLYMITLKSRLQEMID